MTVYFEVIFISNCFIDFFIFALTLNILKRKIVKKRIIIASVLGGLLSAILPFFAEYQVIIKIFGLILFPVIIKSNRYFKEYLLTLSTFLCVTLVLGGMSFAIRYSLDNKLYFYFTYGLIPILFSVSGLITIFIINEFRKSLEKERIYNKNLRMVTISDGKIKYTGEAFFDSGNRVYANNGDPITVVSSKVYNKFQGDEEEIVISTVSGIDILKTKDANLKIYSDDGNNIIYKTKIALAPYLSGKEEIILHGDMGG